MVFFMKLGVKLYWHFPLFSHYFHARDTQTYIKSDFLHKKPLKLITMKLFKSIFAYFSLISENRMKLFRFIFVSDTPEAL